MDVEDALKAMSCIEDLFDGSESSRNRAARLAQELITTPSEFWVTFFDAITADDATRIQAERLIRSGAVTSATTFADLDAILAADQISRNHSRGGDGEL